MGTSGQSEPVTSPLFFKGLLIGLLIELAALAVGWWAAAVCWRWLYR